MRNSRRSLIVALAAVALVSTQAEAQQGLELGVRGGASVASASGDLADTFDSSNLTGFVGGLFLNYDMGILGFQVGGQYTQKGSKLDVGQAVEDFSLNYIEFPVVLKAGIPVGIFKPSVFGGVGLGFNTGCDQEGTDCGEDVKSTVRLERERERWRQCEEHRVDRDRGSGRRDLPRLDLAVGGRPVQLRPERHQQRRRCVR